MTDESNLSPADAARLARRPSPAEREAAFPPSSDMVELVVVDGVVKAHCLVCMVTLPQEIHYLNQAIVAWRDHRAEVDQALNGAKGSDS